MYVMLLTLKFLWTTSFCPIPRTQKKFRTGMPPKYPPQRGLCMGIGHKSYYLHSIFIHIWEMQLHKSQRKRQDLPQESMIHPILLCISLFVYLSIYIFISDCISHYQYVCMYMCMCVYIFIYIYICMYVM